MAEKKVKSRSILLFSREENCVKEVIDFLLNSKCASLENIEEKSNDVETITKYTYGDGSPTVNKENWLGDSKVHFILKLFDPDDISRNIFGDNVIFILSDDADINLIINIMRKELYPSRFERLTIIGKRCNRFLEEPLQYLITTRWRWNDRVAYHWFTRLPVRNNLWFHICGFSGENCPTRVSYSSKPIYNLKLSILMFFNLLLHVIYSNIRSLSNGTETNSVSLDTLSREGFFYRLCSIPSKDLLMQCNVSTLSEFNSLLKEEVKQLACHLPRLIILCDDMFYYGSEIFKQFEKIENCKDLYMKELKSVNKENITEGVLHSLNIMSGMKYTGHYIKRELGIHKINALRDHLLLRNVEGNFWYVTETIVESPLGDGGKEEIQGENKIRETHSDNRIQDLHIDNRIGNIQLIKSLRDSLQEITEELKNVRHLQENYMKHTTEKMSNLEQKLNDVCTKKKE